MKPHSLLANYLQGVESAFAALRGVYVENYLEELLSPTRATLRIRIRFPSGGLLEINEAVVVECGRLQHLDYRYHCQGPEAQLVFCYDSTPHFPDLPGFPHHKHLPFTTLPARRPPLEELIAEAASSFTD